jgi:type IV secretory pathway TraG/TraD family ATPase VirD4
MMLDLLILRAMSETTSGAFKTWFVLDEVASLQRLPQLVTAITEGRKSGIPMVLGFQGKSQLETIYGHVAEAMLSQPATKVFLRTSEPNAADWISRTIGEIELERLRENESYGPENKRSHSEQVDVCSRRLVMASEISGLAPLHGYIKLGNFVAKFKTSHTPLVQLTAPFIERKIPPVIAAADHPALCPVPDNVQSSSPGTAGNARYIFQ